VVVVKVRVMILNNLRESGTCSDEVPYHRLFCTPTVIFQHEQATKQQSTNTQHTVKKSTAGNPTRPIHGKDETEHPTESKSKHHIRRRTNSYFANEYKRIIIIVPVHHHESDVGKEGRAHPCCYARAYAAFESPVQSGDSPHAYSITEYYRRGYLFGAFCGEGESTCAEDE